MSKTFANAYLFNKYPDYQRKMIEFIMKAKEVDKGEDLSDVIYEVKKRQVDNSLVNVLLHKNVIILYSDTIDVLPLSFKVFAAKDIKGDKKLKVFIDASEYIIKNEESGKYECNVNILISYLLSASTCLKYYIDEDKIVMNAGISELGSLCFSSLFTHIIDYLFRVSSTPLIKNKCIYLSSMYFITNILGREPNERMRYLCRQNACISEREENIINIFIKENSYSNIKNFVETVADVLKLDKLTIDVFIEKWAYLYGVGTIFATELFPSFSSMITDAYVGAYINNQKTIEKVCGRNMVMYTKKLLDIGGVI